MKLVAELCCMEDAVDSCGVPITVSYGPPRFQAPDRPRAVGYYLRCLGPIS